MNQLRAAKQTNIQVVLSSAPTGLITMERREHSFNDYSLLGGLELSSHAGADKPLPVAKNFSVSMLMEMQRASYSSRIEALERELAELRSALGLGKEPPRELPLAGAMEEIKAYFEQHHGETIYPSDVAEALQLDYTIVVEALESLASEGKVAIVEETTA